MRVIAFAGLMVLAATAALSMPTASASPPLFPVHRAPATLLRPILPLQQTRPAVRTDSAIRAAEVPGATLRVFLLTIGPGASIYERFGHNAIWIHDTATLRDLIYNYGTFAFPRSLGEAIRFDFRFVMGRPRYWLSVDSDLNVFMREYQYRQRNVDAQELRLTNPEKADLATRLANNALPANREYTYDYFLDNCSTRIRDMLDAVLAGRLRRATQGRPGTETYRAITRRSITNAPLLYVGIDEAFGPWADRRPDRWGGMFLPINVEHVVQGLHARAEAGGGDGGGIGGAAGGGSAEALPLVAMHFQLLHPDVYHVADVPPRWTAPLLAIGILISAVILLAFAPNPFGTIGRLAASAWLVLIGVAGLLLLFFWLVTAQQATWRNFNLLILSPLALGLIPAVWRNRADLRSGAWWFAALMGSSLVLGIAAAMLAPQEMSTTMALVVLPTMAALAVAVVGERRATRLAGSDADSISAGEPLY